MLVKDTANVMAYQALGTAPEPSHPERGAVPFHRLSDKKTAIKWGPQHSESRAQSHKVIQTEGSSMIAFQSLCCLPSLRAEPGLLQVPLLELPLADLSLCHYPQPTFK